MFKKGLPLIIKANAINYDIRDLYFLGIGYYSKRLEFLDNNTELNKYLDKSISNFNTFIKDYEEMLSYEGMEDWVKALRIFYIGSFRRLAACYAAQFNFKLSNEYYEKTIELDPTDVEANYKIGKYYCIWDNDKPHLSRNIIEKCLMRLEKKLLVSDSKIIELQDCMEKLPRY